jgi:chemotaxis protein MotB
MAKALGLLILVGMAASAAVYQWLYLPLGEARRENSELHGRVADLEDVRDRLERESGALQQEVLEKEGELAALRSAQDELAAQLEQEITDHRVQVERIRDELRVEMVDEILFSSGETTLKPEGMEVLRKVGGVLRKAGGRTVEVQGHTDDVPIRGALADRFPTNWDLSAGRAVNVVRFLQDDVGLDPALLSATAHSKYRPRASNETPEGRGRNRRIEILLGPAPPAEPAVP